MRIPTFTFKNEAIWMIVLPLAPAVLALLVILILRLLR
jgi:hypothetical protein